MDLLFFPPTWFVEITWQLTFHSWGQQMEASARLRLGSFHTKSRSWLLAGTMTQLSLLLAWKLSVLLAACIKLDLSTWKINPFDISHASCLRHTCQYKSFTWEIFSSHKLRAPSLPMRKNHDVQCSWNVLQICEHVFIMHSITAPCFQTRQQFEWKFKICGHLIMLLYSD